MQIKDFMRSDVVTLTKDRTLKEAAELMENHKIGSIIIVDEQTKPIGMVTRTDVLNEFVSGDKVNTKIPLEKYINDPMHTITTKDSLEKANNVFSQLMVHHLVVTDEEGNLAGVVSTMDIIKVQNRISRAFPYFIKK